MRCKQKRRPKACSINLRIRFQAIASKRRASVQTRCHPFSARIYPRQRERQRLERARPREKVSHREYACTPRLPRTYMPDGTEKAKVAAGHRVRRSRRGNRHRRLHVQQRLSAPACRKHPSRGLLQELPVDLHRARHGRLHRRAQHGGISQAARHPCGGRGLIMRSDASHVTVGVKLWSAPDWVMR